MNIDFSQMHCGRNSVRDQMEQYIDQASAKPARRIQIPASELVFLMSRDLFSNLVADDIDDFLNTGEITDLMRSNKYINSDYVVHCIDRAEGIDTPEELQEVLTRWGHL